MTTGNIYLENFLADCGVTKFKKLLRVIKMSYTPPVYVETLRTYMTEYLENAVDIKSNITTAIRKCDADIEEMEKQLANLIYKRRRVKQQLKKILSYTTYTSQEYRLTKDSEIQLTTEIKTVRDDLISARVNLKLYISTFKKIEKNTKNFKKYLELLKDV